MGSKRFINYSQQHKMTKMDMKKPGVVLAAEIVGYVMSSCLVLGALFDFDSDSVFAIFAAGGLIAASAFMRRRKEWARIAFTVISSILILGCLVEINQSGDVANETITIWLRVCLAMLICAIVFCWLPKANDWFKMVEQDVGVPDTITGQNECIEEPSSGNTTGVTQYMVSFPEAVRRFCMTCTYNGRASRSEFWWSLLLCVMLILGVSTIFGEDGVVTNITLLAVALMGLLIGWRRIHDIGKSGWWFLVPIYNIWLLVQPSQLQENKFGKVPNTTPSGKNMVWNRVSWTIIGVSLLAFLFLGDSDEDDQPIEDAVIRYCNSIRNSDEDAWRALVFMDAAGKKGSIADLLKEEPNSEKKRTMEFLINRMYKEQLDLKNWRMKGMFEHDIEVVEIVPDGSSEAYVHIRSGNEDIRNKILIDDNIVAFELKTCKANGKWLIDPTHVAFVDGTVELQDEARKQQEVVDRKRTENIKIEMKQTAEDGSMKMASEGAKLLNAILNSNMSSPQKFLSEMNNKDNSYRDDYENRNDYFKALFDYENRKKAMWKPRIQMDVAMSWKNHVHSDSYSPNWIWHIVSVDFNKLPNWFPVLLSDNVTGSDFSFDAGKYDLRENKQLIQLPEIINTERWDWKFEWEHLGADRQKNFWQQYYLIVVRKNGKAERIPREKCTMATIFPEPFELTEKIKFL